MMQCTHEAIIGPNCQHIGRYMPRAYGPNWGNASYMPMDEFGGQFVWLMARTPSSPWLRPRSANQQPER